MEENPPNPMNMVLGSFQMFVENYGWYIIGLVVLAYNVGPHLSTYMAERANKLSLASAKDPERVQVLDIEARRIREEQQNKYVEVADSTKLARKKKAESEAKKPKPRGGGGGGGYNPLTGSVSRGYTPSGFQKKGGGK